VKVDSLFDHGKLFMITEKQTNEVEKDLQIMGIRNGHAVVRGWIGG